MNSEQLVSLLRIALQFIGGAVVSRGWVDADTMTTVVGAILTLAGAAWSIYARRNVGLVASAAAVPGVQSITASPKIANAVPDMKVQAR